MPGLYIHIPFCRQACHYCNFHFSTGLKYKDRMVSALCDEIAMRARSFSGQKLQSIYFGGGTPSLLDGDELDSIFSTINTHFGWDADAEITLEANPDDLTYSRMREISSSPINRISLGVQSFQDEDLRFMNRIHSAREALTAIERIRSSGIEKITIDLIYGAPCTSTAMWKKNLARVIELDLPHISCYHLTLEDRTAYAHMVKTGKALPPLEEKGLEQFRLLMEFAREHHYLHYEISNFSKGATHIAVHNSSYWCGAHYLGIGPSAHSFDGTYRSWNVANNARYMRAIESGLPDMEKEKLSPADRYNEYILTGLRTIWGVMIGRIHELGEPFVQTFHKNAQPYLENGFMVLKEDKYILSDEGKCIADRIVSDLMHVG